MIWSVSMNHNCVKMWPTLNKASAEGRRSVGFSLHLFTLAFIFLVFILVCLAWRVRHRSTSQRSASVLFILTTRESHSFWLLHRCSQLAPLTNHQERSTMFGVLCSTACPDPPPTRGMHDKSMGLKWPVFPHRDVLSSFLALRKRVLPSN